MFKKATVIKIDVKLKDIESKVLDEIIENYKKCDKVSTKEIIDFIFRIGMMYTHGTMLGNMMYSILKKDNISIIGKLEKIPETEDAISIDKVFFDGEPAEFKTSQDDEILMFRNTTSINEDNDIHSIYILKNNKPIKWKGGNNECGNNEIN